MTVGPTSGAVLAPARAAERVAPAPAASPVTLLVGGAAGGASDGWVRAFAPFLERHLAPPRLVRVANRPAPSPGGGLLEVAREVAASDDAGLLGHATTPDLPARAREAGAEDVLRRLRFLGAVSEEPLVLVATPGTDAADLRAPVLTAAGRVLALPPEGSAAALAAPALEAALGLTALHFPSAAAARQAAKAGHAAAALLRLPDVLAAVREGRLAAIGVAAEAAVSSLPEVPPLAAALGVPLIASARRGFVVSARASAAATAPLAAALAAAVADPEYVAQADALGLVPRHLDGSTWAAVALSGGAVQPSGRAPRLAR